VPGGKLHADPRIRPLNNFLRRMSLDELPQLWSVLRREMSLVDPCPVRPDEVAAVYEASSAAYESGLRGLSGLWQVSGRNRLSYEQRVALDCYYVNYSPLRLDIWILSRTTRAILTGSGC
jgi:lipopolysaccharide/colanic/teichoic acid biosynthesis glycosyltransferase